MKPLIKTLSLEETLARLSSAIDAVGANASETKAQDVEIGSRLAWAALYDATPAHQCTRGRIRRFIALSERGQKALQGIRVQTTQTQGYTAHVQRRKEFAEGLLEQGEAYVVGELSP